MHNNNENDIDHNNDETQNTDMLHSLSNDLYYSYDSDDDLFGFDGGYSSDEEEFELVNGRYVLRQLNAPALVEANQQPNDSDANLLYTFGMLQGLQRNLNLSQPTQDNDQTSLENLADKNARNVFLHTL